MVFGAGARTTRGNSESNPLCLCFVSVKVGTKVHSLTCESVFSYSRKKSKPKPVDGQERRQSERSCSVESLCLEKDS